MVGTEIVALGLIGFSANCIILAINTIGVEKTDPEKLAQPWGLAHLFLGTMMVIVGVATFMTNAVGNDLISGFFGTALAWFGFFWIFTGATLVLGFDLRVVGQISIPFAIVDLWFINGSLTVYEELGIEAGTLGTLGPGMYSLTILLVILTIVFLLVWPATHGRAGLFKVNAYLLIILALLGFYIAFGFFFPGFSGPVLPI